MMSEDANEAQLFHSHHIPFLTGMMISNSVASLNSNVTSFPVLQKNYEYLYRRLKHDHNNLRQKYENVLRRTQQDIIQQEFTATVSQRLALLSRHRAPPTRCSA